MNARVEAHPSPRRLVTMRCAITMGPIVGNIIATIIVSHIPPNTGALIAIGMRVPTWPSPSSIPDISAALRAVSAHANAAHAINSAKVTNAMRRSTDGISPGRRTRPETRCSC